MCAVTCDCYPDDPLMRRTAEAAASAGFDYHVICSMKEGQSEHDVFNGVHVHRICIKKADRKPLGRITARPCGTTLLLWSLFAALAFKKVARLHLQRRFDVVHVHNLPDFLAFAALVPKSGGGGSACRRRPRRLIGMCLLIAGRAISALARERLSGSTNQLCN